MSVFDNKSEGYFSNKLLFEFTVDQQQFLKQIKNENGTINIDLISHFLNQFLLLSSKDLYNNDDITDLDLLETSLENEYRLKVLKNLSLKISSQVKFDLNILYARLPCVILNTLFIEFYKIFDDEDLSKLNFDNFDYSTILPEALFAILLYHRWCLKLLVDDGFTKRPLKTNNLQVPGLTNPTLNFGEMKENIIKKIKERQHVSIAVLEKLMHSKLNFKIVRSECFEFDEKRSLNYDWSKSITLSQNELISLIAFDLGCTYFHMRKYDAAYINFKQCKEHKEKITDAYLPHIDQLTLDSYLKTCMMVTGSSMHAPASIIEKVQESIRANLQGLTGLLLEDIIRKELSLPLRASLEEQALNAKRQNSLYEEIVVCNSIREALEGRPVCCKLINILSYTKGIIDFFLKVCVDVYLCIPDEEKEKLKFFLRFLASALPNELNFIHLMLSSPLNEMFSDVDFAHHLDDLENPKVTMSIIEFPLFETNSDEEALFKFELDVASCFDVEKLRNLLSRIQIMQKYSYLKCLSNKYVLTNNWKQWLDNLPNLHHNFRLLLQILVHKSALCLKQGNYQTSWQLLKYIEIQMSQSGESMNQCLMQIGLELLKVALCAANQMPPIFLADVDCQDLINKCKFCISNVDYEFRNNENLSPLNKEMDDLLTRSVAYLLNNCDYQYLASLNPKGNHIIQIVQKLSVILQELNQGNAVRSSFSEFLTIVGNICSNETSTIILHERIHQFFTYIRNELAITILISAFARLHIIADDNISYQIFAEFSTTWPTTLLVQSSKGPQSNNDCDKINSLQSEVVFRYLYELLNSALFINSQNVSWIRSKADFHFFLKESNKAMSHYIKLLTIMTNYFNEQIPINTVTETVIRKMITCCNNIGCNTQAAVLCQFLEEVDYTTMFASLQEMQICDAMDGYYEFFWDITVLEFLVNLHARRGEVSKKHYCTKLIGQLELNCSNPVEMLAEAARVRKAGFLRCLCNQYLN